MLDHHQKLSSFFHVLTFYDKTEIVPDDVNTSVRQILYNSAESFEPHHRT